MENTIKCVTMEEVIQASQEGHSFFLLGQAGTGKTFTLRRIIDSLQKNRLRVLVSASTGIAAVSLPGGKTVHNLFGLMDGRFSSGELINKIDNDANFYKIKQNITQTDALIIDEISMLSRVTLLQLEEVIRSIRGRALPFGGMQVIAAGDFYQLKPVPNPVNTDPGELVIEDDFIRMAIPHHFILNEVHRQSEDDLIAAIHQLSKGTECTQNTIKLMTELQRPLPPNSRPIKLFADNYDVDKCNSSNLLNMQGALKMYKSVNSGNIQALKRCMVPDKLFLKVGAPVILLANISNHLVNGLRGTVKQLHDDHIVVKFVDVPKETDIYAYNFSVYDTKIGGNVANRKQLPVKLAYALTVHKAQGMSLQHLEVDCRKMAIPGQIGVAVGRAVSKNGLRVINFNSNNVVRQPKFIEEFYTSKSAPFKDGCVCCTRAQLAVNIPQPSQVQCTNNAEPMLLTEQSSDDDDAVEFLEFFEKGLEAAQNLTLPDNIIPDHCLSDLYFETECTYEQKQMNNLILFLKARAEITRTFFKLVYHKIEDLFHACISVENATGSSFTEFYGRIHKFVGSKLYSDYVKLLFTTSNLSSIQYRLAFGILEMLRKQVVSSAALNIKKSAVQYVSMIGSKTFRSSPGGDGTIRYIGGWCLGSLRYGKQKRVISNLYNDSNKEVVENCHNDVLLLDSLMCNEAEAKETAKNPATLHEIERKNNLKGSLCHIHDKTFVFFQILDKFIRKYETVEYLAIHGKELYDVILSKVLEDESVAKTWEALFETNDYASSLKVQTTALLKDIVEKYLRLSASQFRKEYLRMLKVKKAEAHRKQIRMKDSKPAQTAVPHSSKCTKNVKAPTKRGKSNMNKKMGKGKGKSKKSKMVQWPCGGCNNECLMECVCCDSCDIWFHYQCLGLYGDEAELEEDEWFCPECKYKTADEHAG